MTAIAAIGDRGTGMAEAKSAPRRLPGLWLTWAVVAVFATFMAIPLIADYRAVESDDWLRLLQVRDWVAGQGWFDSHQYRMNPPEGADIHWVRLVDIPLGAVLFVVKPFFDQRTAETIMMTVVPLFQLLVAMLLVRGAMRDLKADAFTSWLAIAIIPVCPLLITSFVPMRIDHHAWQAILAFGMVWMLVRGGWRNAAIGGVMAATLLWISVEGLAIVAVVGGLYALRFWLEDKRDLEGFLGALAIAGPALLVVLRPPSEYAIAWSDMMSWPHMLAFGGAALWFTLARRLPLANAPACRLAVLAPLPAIALAAVLVPLGMAALMPMSTLDPILQDNWQQHLVESVPIWRQIPSSALMNLFTVAIFVFGGLLAHRTIEDAEAKARWTMLAFAGFGASAIALLVMRAGLTAQLIMLPFSALIIAHYLPRARALAKTLPRALATVALFILATPATASMVGKIFNNEVNYTLVSHPKLGVDGRCLIDRLRALPPSHMFASLDLSAQVLGRTDHTVVMGGYHRNEEAMLDVFNAFGGPLDEAEAIVKRHNADFVVSCTGSADLAAYANMGEDNLADRIFDRNPPGWLEPVEEYETGPIRVYRVR